MLNAQNPGWQHRCPLCPRQSRRLAVALFFSLLSHVLLFSLTFGGQEFGLPGFALPWQKRRVEVPELRIELAPSPRINLSPSVISNPLPLPTVLEEKSLSHGPLILTFRVPQVAPEPLPPSNAARSSTIARTGARSRAENGPVVPKVSAQVTPPRKPFPAVIALERSADTEFVVPAPPKDLSVSDLAIPTVSNSESHTPETEVAINALPTEIDQTTPKQETTLVKAESVSQEIERHEVVRLAAAKEDSIRAEDARQEAERKATDRQEPESQEAARQAAAKQEAARAEAVRQEIERQASARQEIERQEAARQAAAKQEAAIAEAARQEATREQNARRDAARRAMGRQLDEEAARREAAQLATRQSPSSSALRRGRLLGRVDPNAELVLYAEAWARRIQLNGAFDTVREPATQPHTDPLVTIAIRSDGSVESVTFVRSSGVAAIDDAIRHIVQSQTPFQPFPPGLARDFDVLEIRRTWHFDTAIRLY